MAKAKNILKNVTLLSITAACVFLTIGCKSKDRDSYKYPNANVILILIDTLRADHLSCYGYHRDTSPEIDKLAQEGIIFKNMLAQASWTKPGTASILTGLYPKNHGANTKKDSLAEEVILLPEILNRVGYSSYAFIANLNVGKKVGFNQGYRDFFSCEDRIKREKKFAHALSDEVNMHVSEVIRHIEKPYNNFIYIHYIDPHAPYIPKEKHFSIANKTVFTMDFQRSQAICKMDKEEQDGILKEMINAYDDEILFNDKMIGNVVRALKEKNMYDNSIIIVTSDHGEEFLEHDGIGHGKTLYDEQLRVPLIVRLPNKIHREIVKNANQVDICPTVLSLLKIPIPNVIDGIDLFDKKVKPREFNYAELKLGAHLVFSIQSHKNKLIERILSPLQATRRSRWFKEKALLEIDKNPFRLVIRSFREDREVQVLSEGKTIKELVVTPKRKFINILLPQGNVKKRQVIIKSPAPCREAKDTVRNQDTPCLSFCIFNSKNIGLKNIIGELYHKYYTLADDPGEKSNRYKRKRFKKIIIELRKKLWKYKSDKRNLLLNKKPVIFDKEQLEQLKALGYI